MTTELEFIRIIASSEPNGEGEGFVDCANEEATIFFVYEGDDVVNAFPTLEEAQVFVDGLYAEYK